MKKLDIRSFVPEDLGLIRQIHSNDFPIPNTDCLLYLSKKVVLSGQDLIAAGFCRLTSEGIVIINPELPLSIRTRALNMLITEMVRETREAGMDECHVFVDHPNTCKFLERLGFQFCSGIPMVIPYY